MANSRSSDWSGQYPGGRFRVFEGTGRGNTEDTGHEPPYYLNGYEHEGYEEQIPGPREPDELAHDDDGYLPGWESSPGYLPPADPWDSPADPWDSPADPWDSPADPWNIPAESRDTHGTPADPWDAPDSGYAFPRAWHWEAPEVPAPRGPRAQPDPRSQPDPRVQPDPRTWRGSDDDRAASRSPRTLWMAAIGAVGLVAAVLVFRWIGEAPPASAPAAHTHAAAAPAGAMTAAGMATLSYRLIAAKQADGFGYNANASHRMSAASAIAGGATGLARCLEAKGLSAGGTVTAVRYAQYSDGKDVTGLSLIGFGGTFGPGAARHLWHAAGACGALAPGAAATTAAPGPHGGTLYTGTGNPDGTTCAWATGTTAALVWFFNGMTGLTVRDPAAACQAVRSAVEARPLYRTYACCART